MSNIWIMSLEQHGLKFTICSMNIACFLSLPKCVCRLGEAFSVRNYKRTSTVGEHIVLSLVDFVRGY